MTEDAQTGRNPIANIADITDVANIADVENPIANIADVYCKLSEIHLFYLFCGKRFSDTQIIDLYMYNYLCL